MAISQVYLNQHGSFDFIFEATPAKDTARDVSHVHLLEKGLFLGKKSLAFLCTEEFESFQKAAAVAKSQEHKTPLWHF